VKREQQKSVQSSRISKIKEKQMQQFAKDNSRNIKLPKINRSDVKQGNITLKLINTSVPEKPKKSAER
jgi:hypothetical protein